MPRIPPPIEMLRAYDALVENCRRLEETPAEMFGEMFDAEIEDAINSLANAISMLGWIPEAIRECRGELQDAEG